MKPADEGRRLQIPGEPRADQCLWRINRLDGALIRQPCGVASAERDSAC